MKRTIRKDIRWNQDEIERIDLVRGEQEFSDFVRTAVMDKVYEHTKGE